MHITQTPLQREQM